MYESFHMRYVYIHVKYLAKVNTSNGMFIFKVNSREKNIRECLLQTFNFHIKN